MAPAKVGNSSFATRWYDVVCGNRLYAGRRRFMTRYVRSFPLPDRRHPAVAGIVRLARELAAGGTGPGGAEEELDRLVRASFGLPAVGPR